MAREVVSKRCESMSSRFGSTLSKVESEMLTLRFDSEDSARLLLPHRRLLAGKWLLRPRESYLHLR